MKHIIVILTIVASYFICDAKTVYSCFLSQDVNMNTYQVSNQYTDNSLAEIIVDGNKLTLGTKMYSMYNRSESTSGFRTIVKYDAIDNKDQRCKILFITNSSADWTGRNTVVIWYHEISPIAKWYQSRDPQTR